MLNKSLIKIISETNGLSLNNTLELLELDPNITLEEKQLLHEFKELTNKFQADKILINQLLDHPIYDALFYFFKNFPIPYYEEHIHLTGSLTPEFIWKHFEPLIKGKDKDLYQRKIEEVYQEKNIKLTGPKDIQNLIQLEDGEDFTRYLKILFLPKLILRNREIHEKAAYHLAEELFENFNVGNIRLKFTLSRSTGIESEKIPGLENITEDDVILGLYSGFTQYKKKNPLFNFTLTPSFRKEAGFYNQEKFNSKKDHFEDQVQLITSLIAKNPEIADYLTEVDTVGDEKELYRKIHFEEMKHGFRKLQYLGFKIKSHHGETWKVLRKGVQSVDNAMNIWHIDTLEHGISLGINPNYYLHRIFQQALDLNQKNSPIPINSVIYREVEDMNWRDLSIKNKILSGEKISPEEIKSFTQIKFHTAREIEHYQHDVLNRMINKKVSLVALPSSNLKLTGSFPDFKDHPFSWWEKKGVQLGIGTDNYITLKTNYIREMIILLLSEPENLKITKLLMIATKEKRRAFISHLLWEMRKKLAS